MNGSYTISTGAPVLGETGFGKISHTLCGMTKMKM